MKNHTLHEKLHFDTLRELLEWAAKKYEGKYAYSYTSSKVKQDKRIKFEEFAADVRALASELSAMGCRGKHCCVIGKFSYDFALMYYATLSIGAVLIPLDKDWSKAELADTASKAEADYLFADEEISEKAEHVASVCKLCGDVVYLNSEMSESSLEKLIDRGRDRFSENPSLFYDAPIDPEKMALLVFTSGTTGKGKGVMLSQKAILSDLYNVTHYIDFADKTVGVLPPHHTYGSSIMLVGHVMIGCEVYISSGLKYIQKELKEERPGHLILVPLYLETFYRRIQDNIKKSGKEKKVAFAMKLSGLLRKIGIDVRRRLFSEILAAFGGNVRMIITGGAPINPDIMNFYDSIGITVLNGYGITECAPLISVNRSRNIVRGSVGNPIDEVEVKIDSPDENGEGEILVKGPNVMLGYFRDEDATREAFTEDGYFRTGDYGKLEGGVVFITGRKKNLIILSNGKNVYPEEIENEFTATPGVLNIIVYEGKSRRGMEHNAIVAEIYPDREWCEKNGISDIQSYLKSFVDEYNKHATPYKKIGVLKVRDEEFPKNTLRKIQRFKLDMTID